MRKLIPILLAVLIIYGCTDDGKLPTSKIPQKNQPSIRIKTSQKDQLVYGDTLRFSVESIDEGRTMKEVRVSHAESRKVLSTSTSGIFILPTSVTGGGKLKLKIEATFEDGSNSTRYRDFVVVHKEAPKQWTFEIIKKYPHNIKSFTQGLLIHKGFLYEGTGQFGESRLLKSELLTGQVILERRMEDNEFSEGITIMNGKLYQLSYKSGVGRTFKADTFEPIGQFNYDFATNEGWGLTNNDTALIASDGSSTLYFLDPETFQETGRLSVFSDRGDVSRLNELEYREGTVYANVFTTADIVAIDLKTGRVTDTYSARGIVDRSEVTARMDVLNGIAINPLNGNLLITGKYWSNIYEVRPLPAVEF